MLTALERRDGAKVRDLLESDSVDPNHYSCPGDDLCPWLRAVLPNGLDTALLSFIEHGADLSLVDYRPRGTYTMWHYALHPETGRERPKSMLRIYEVLFERGVKPEWTISDDRFGEFNEMILVGVAGNCLMEFKYPGWADVSMQLLTLVEKNYSKRAVRRMAREKFGSFNAIETLKRNRGSARWSEKCEPVLERLEKL